MKLFDCTHYNDFGDEWYFQVLTSRKFALLDATLQWDDYGGDELFPLLILSIGSKSLFGFTFRWKRFEFSFELIDTAPRNLNWYRDRGRYGDID